VSAVLGEGNGRVQSPHNTTTETLNKGWGERERGERECPSHLHQALPRPFAVQMAKRRAELVALGAVHALRQFLLRVYYVYCVHG
jgi:hypothetical protein